MDLISLRRGKAQFIMVNRIREGLSNATQVLRELRDMGLGFRTQTFYQDWNYFDAQFGKEGHAKFLNAFSTPGERSIVNTPWATNRLYSYRVRLLIQDSNTGEEREEWVSIEYDEKLTRSEAEEMARDIYEGSQGDERRAGRGRYAGSLTGTQLESVYRGRR